MKLAHIINPVKVSEQSDLFIAQPITFESMRRAKEFAKGEVEVELYTTQYPEDREIIPDYFTLTPDLERSILDIADFNASRKLPLLADILDRLYHAASDADYLIYTNTDIGLQPYFYTAVKRYIERGYDAFTINRRTIPKHYTSLEELEEMYAEVGEKHPGYDCLVFKRELYPKFYLANMILGAAKVGLALYVNMRVFAQKFLEEQEACLTFHIGDDRVWWLEKFRAYTHHNNKELSVVRDHLASVSPDVDRYLREAYPLLHPQRRKAAFKRAIRVNTNRFFKRPLLRLRSFLLN